MENLKNRIKQSWLCLTHDGYIQNILNKSKKDGHDECVAKYKESFEAFISEQESDSYILNERTQDDFHIVPVQQWSISPEIKIKGMQDIPLREFGCINYFNQKHTVRAMGYCDKDEFLRIIKHNHEHLLDGISSVISKLANKRTYTRIDGTVITEWTVNILKK